MAGWQAGRLQINDSYYHNTINHFMNKFLIQKYYHIILSSFLFVHGTASLKICHCDKIFSSVLGSLSFGIIFYILNSGFGIIIAQDYPKIILEESSEIDISMDIWPCSCGVR